MSMAQTALTLLLTLAMLSGSAAVCNPATSAISTQVKVDPGQTGTSGTNCYFPFIYSGVTYNDCIGVYCTGTYCNYWCATSCNYGTDSLWNYCKYRLSDLSYTNCSGLTAVAASSEPSQLYGGTGSGTTCYFPFLYGGVCYYDCIPSGENMWCATTDVAVLVNTNFKYCRYTLAGKRDPSCAAIDSSTPYYLPPQVGNYSLIGLSQTDMYGNCTFPFYYNGKCYDDCTTVDATKWYLMWCSTEQYYMPNKKARICPYYRKYQTYTGMALSWGFYRIYLNDGCGSSGAFCNMSMAMATGSVPVGAYGSPRIILSSTTADVFEVMPQGNGFFILRLPMPCATNFLGVTTDSSDIVYDYVASEREFWNINAAATPGMFTIQSTWNATAGYHLTRGALSSYQVGKLDSVLTSEWRFDRLTNADLAGLSLPCESPTNVTNSTNVDGAWCSWSSYSISGGTGTRTRACSCPAQSGSGAACPGSSNDSGPTVNGTWCSWSNYNVSGAYGTRTRDCNCSAAAYGGINCTGSSNDTGLAVNAGWCAWSSYSVSGAYATRTRNCSCPSADYGGSSVCTGSSNDTGLTVNGNWCSWSSYSINGAYGTRTRDCNCSAAAYGGVDCTGSSNDTGLAVNGTWCAWSSYTVTGGYATRLRLCTCPASDYGGQVCQGSANDTGAVVNGDWCSWSAYTVSAGIGTRTRNCGCPVPDYTGSSCTGSTSDSLTQVNGSWCSWTSLTSGYGVLTRTRLCNCSAPNAVGTNCTGAGSEDFPCNVTSCLTTTPSAVDGAWCSWGSWVAGNVNSGVMSRTRSCTCPAASGTGAACSGSTSESGTCTLTGCKVFYAVPAESGSVGTSFTSTDTYNRLVIWGSVIGGCILLSAIVGLALMFKQIASGGA